MKLFQTFFRGIGQVMLQNNAITGVLFLTGIFYNSWLLGLGAMLGNAISTLAAVFFKYDPKDIEDGLYGFNGTLVGIAVFFFFGYSPLAIFAIIFGAAISTLFMYFMKLKLPPYTGPFVVATWITMVGLKILNIEILASGPFAGDSLNIIPALSMGFGQVMFQANVVTGILFLLGILVNSPMCALYGFYGSLIGMLFAFLIGLPFSAINIGIFGYNAVLCGIALGDTKIKQFSIMTFSVVLSVLVNYGMDKVGIVTLTAPFVISTWLGLTIAFLVNKYVRNT